MFTKLKVTGQSDNLLARRLPNPLHFKMVRTKFIYTEITVVL